jgi:ornithine carbamoyltransferase
MSVAATALAGLLRISDLSATQLNALLELGDEMRSGPSWWTGTHSDGTVACLLDEPSAWAGASFQHAAQRLGMVTATLKPGELERAPANSRAIVVATPAHAALEKLAREATVPVVNASTRDHHPCQALADLLTMRRHFGYLDGLRVAYLGEGDNVAHSLMEAGALAGMHVVVATPRGREPHHEVTLGAIALAPQHGGSVRLGHDPRDAVALADVVYAGASSHADRSLIGCTLPGAVYMCREAGIEPIELSGSLVAEQPANRLPTAQALLHAIVAGGSGR